VIARFSTEEAARSWFDAVLGKLDRTTLLAAGATAPVWWPDEKESERPQWSRRGELPAARLCLFVNVWAEITDPEQFFDYSVHYRWTVEHAGGLVLAPGPKPFQQVLRGGPAPHAMALMACPTSRPAMPGTTARSTARTAISGTGRRVPATSASALSRSAPNQQASTPA